MKLNSLVYALGMTMALAGGSAMAADQGHGTVTFKGAIIDSPCSITPDTIDQTVNMGQVSNKALENGGKSNPRPFYIKLENCDVSALTDKTVQATFSGSTSSANSDHLAITGTASGASIALTTEGGNDMKLGQPSPAIQIQDNNNTLSFAAYLQGDNLASGVTPGEFTSVANFTLAYQ